MRSVSVVVPVHNGADALPSLLAALACQATTPFEVVVVDNASTDATAAVAAASPVVSRVVTEHRPGSYAARNAGWRAASGTVVVFTDADCVPQAGWLRALEAALEAGPDLAGGAVVPGPAPAGRWPSWWAAYDRTMYLDQEENITRDGFAATANLAVRRTVLEEVGGFDDSLKSGGDHAFTSAAVAAGHQLVWCPEAVVLHVPRAGLRATWALWRRLGQGYADLAVRGAWPVSLRRDPVLRRTLAEVQERARHRGVEVSTVGLAIPHAVARAAVLRGRLEGASGI